MSPKKSFLYLPSSFLDFFKYLILYHIMLRSHSLKEKYVYIWKFSTVIWRRLTLLNMFLDGITHHSSSFISFFLINFVIIQACISIIPSFLAPSPSDEVHTSRDTFITTRVWNQKLWILMATFSFCFLLSSLFSASLSLSSVFPVFRMLALLTHTTHSFLDTSLDI